MVFVAFWQDKCRDGDLSRNWEIFRVKICSMIGILHSLQPSWLFYCSFKKFRFQFIVRILFYPELEFKAGHEMIAYHPNMKRKLKGKKYLLINNKHKPAGPVHPDMEWLSSFKVLIWVNLLLVNINLIESCDEHCDLIFRNLFQCTLN